MNNKTNQPVKPGKSNKQGGNLQQANKGNQKIPSNSLGQKNNNDSDINDERQRRRS
jgi:hypothetical protein